MHMSRWFFVAALFVTCLSTASAQDNRWSGGMLNGYAWRQMDDVARTYYVAGVVEVSSTLEDDPRRPVDLEKCRCTAGQLIDGVTSFYKMANGPNERLMRLPILAAVTGDCWRRS